MGKNIVEKILSKHIIDSNNHNFSYGDIVNCKVDLLMAHDSSGPRRWWPRLKKFNAKPFDPNKIVIVSDHFVPPCDRETADIVALTAKFAHEFGTHFHDREGVCHTILSEYGYVQPGIFGVGGDSHSPTAGAFGAFMCGYGATDTTGVLIKGEIWEQIPRVMAVILHGSPKQFITSKDIALFLCSNLDIDTSTVIEYKGSAVKNFSMQSRMTLTNMAPEIGAMTAIINPDELTRDYIISNGNKPVDDFFAYNSDEDAKYFKQYKLDVSDLKPQLSLPHNPQNVDLVENHRDVKVDQCYIGACTGAKVEDLKMAAQVLKGKKIAKTTRLLVAPASHRILKQASENGTLKDLICAGAQILHPGCAACGGYGGGLLADGEVAISTTNRNYQGRMGSQKSYLYLASPYTVAASAIRGYISDPNEL